MKPNEGWDPRSKIAERSFTAILDPGRARMKPNEMHSGGIQDPRSKIVERSFKAILDPGRPRMKPNEIHSGGVLDPRLLGKTPQESWILDPARMNFIRFHSVSFGRAFQKVGSGGVSRMKPNEGWDPRSKIAERSFTAILDPGRAQMKPNEIHPGGIQDPRSKIVERSFKAILDPGRPRMKPNETE